MYIYIYQNWDTPLKYLVCSLLSSLTHGCFTMNVEGKHRLCMFRFHQLQQFDIRFACPIGPELNLVVCACSSLHVDSYFNTMSFERTVHYHRLSSCQFFQHCNDAQRFFSRSFNKPFHHLLPCKLCWMARARHQLQTHRWKLTSAQTESLLD